MVKLSRTSLTFFALAAFSAFSALANLALAGLGAFSALVFPAAGAGFFLAAAAVAGFLASGGFSALAVRTGAAFFRGVAGFTSATSLATGVFSMTISC